MPKQEEMMKLYKIHIDLLNKVITDITKARLQKVIQLEQTIISGIEGTSQNKASNTSLVKQVSQISKELNPKDYLRLLMVYFSVFELSEKDKDTMLKSCGKENYKETIRNLVYLDHSQAIAQKFKRKLPEMTAEEFNDYLRKHS